MSEISDPLSDRKDRLWNESYETFYQCYFEELLAGALLSRWSLFDAGVRTLVALTSSGSVVAGWSLWQSEDLRWIWFTIAGVSAVLATVHTTLNIPDLTKTLGERRTTYCRLRTYLESFRLKLSMNPEFEFDPAVYEYSKLRAEYGSLLEKTEGVLLQTRDLELRIQDELNVRLGIQQTDDKTK